MKKNILEAVYESAPTQILIALVINAFYAAVLGLSLVPSAWIVWTSASRILGFGPGSGGAARGLANLLGGGSSGGPGFGGFVLLGLSGGAAVFAYFLWGAIFQASMVRLLSLGIKPGRYPKVSLTTLRWLIYSGIYNISTRTVLPFIPVSWFITAYFRIVGAKIGRNVFINTPWLNDAYLLTLEEGVILGGNAEISCHLYEREWLHLEPIHIGKDSLIGTGAYVPPGTTIGERCVVGARCYLRKGTQLSDGSVYTVIAGLPARRAFGIEKGR
jgi:acetyltransferase-like isoleucine patch superfamily enzyme